MSPTKLATAGEGGIITTENKELAEKLRAGRDCGSEGDYDPSFVGLNARMSKSHTALGIESFRFNVRHLNKEPFRMDRDVLAGRLETKGSISGNIIILRFIGRNNALSKPSSLLSACESTEAQLACFYEDILHGGAYENPLSSSVLYYS